MSPLKEREAFLEGLHSRYQTVSENLRNSGGSSGIGVIEGVFPVSARGHRVNSCVHLLREKLFPDLTVKAYLLALDHVFAVKGVDFAECSKLFMPMRSFSKSFSALEICPPGWDGTVTLWNLKRALHKPLVRF